MLASISDLKPGDIVRNLGSSNRYVVSETYGNRATGVRTVDITHPKEWVLIVEDSDEDPCSREPGDPPGWERLMVIHSETGAAYPLKVPRGKYRIEVNGKPASVLISTEGPLLVAIP